MKELTTTLLSSGIELINVPELITVQTIKKKILEQLPNYNHQINDLNTGKLVIVGRQGHKVIVRDKHNNLGFIAEMLVDLMLSKQAELEERENTEAWVLSELDQIPQIFEG